MKIGELPKLGSDANFPVFKVKLQQYLVMYGLAGALKANSGLEDDQLEKARAALVLALPNNLTTSLSKLQTAHDIWKELLAIYEPATKARALTLQTELQDSTKREDESVSDFLLRMRDLFKKIGIRQQA